MRKGDFIVIIATLIVALVLSLVMKNSKDDSALFSFRVKQGPKIILENTVGRDYKGIIAFSLNNQTEYVEVNQGKIKLSKMTKEVCPRQICSNLGWAIHQGDILVCLPNKLIVEVIEKEGVENYGTDTISY